MAHLCAPQNQALGVCIGFVPDIQVCGTHGREDLVNATITSNAGEEEVMEAVGLPYGNSAGCYAAKHHTDGFPRSRSTLRDPNKPDIYICRELGS